MNSVLYTVVILTSFYAVSFAIKETSLFDRPRSWLIRQHPFFYQLFSCYFCVGFHSGWIVYLIANPSIDFRQMILWAFSSAAISLLTNMVIDKIQS